MFQVMEEVAKVNRAVADFEKSVNARVIEARMIATRGKELQTQVAELKESEAVYAQVAELFQTFSEDEQQAIQRKFEELISYGLHLVFEDKFKKFQLNAGVERGQVVMNPTVVFDVDGKHEMTSEIIGAHGGGPADVIGFMLKLLVVIFQGVEKVRPIIFLDETFSHLSDEYLPKMAAVIRKFVDEIGTDLQLVLVTHQHQFLDYADKAYKFGLHPYTKHTIVTREK